MPRCLPYRRTRDTEQSRPAVGVACGIARSSLQAAHHHDRRREMWRARVAPHWTEGGHLKRPPLWPRHVSVRLCHSRGEWESWEVEWPVGA